MRQRLTIISLVILSCAFLLTYCAVAQDKMRIGLSSVSGLHAAVWVAEEKGLFRKQGIDAEVIVTGQGGTAGIGALLANDIEIVNASGDVLVASALRGGDTVMIAKHCLMVHSYSFF